MQTESNKISNARIYFLSFVHTVRICSMVFFLFSPLAFLGISVYCLFISEWIKALVYAILCVSIYFYYPTINVWFEEERMKFKKEVDEWSAQLDEEVK